jgi:hypothetical protein
MLKSFKFLSDNEEEVYEDFLRDPEGPSWMWVNDWQNATDLPHEVKVTHHAGIDEFLSMFPDYFITPVISITGPNNRVHTGNEQYPDGWGFDILEDIITVQWINFLSDVD